MLNKNFYPEEKRKVLYILHKNLSALEKKKKKQTNLNSNIFFWRIFNHFKILTDSKIVLFPFDDHSNS